MSLKSDLAIAFVQKLATRAGEAHSRGDIGKLKGKYERLSKAAENGDVLIPALNNAAERIVAGAKQRCPVDTGFLRDSITMFPKKVPGGRGVSIATSEGHLGTGVYYGHFIEYGTRKMTARPFLRPALDEERTRFVVDMAESIGKFALEVAVDVAIGAAITAVIAATGGTGAAAVVGGAVANQVAGAAVGVAAAEIEKSVAPATIKFTPRTTARSSHKRKRGHGQPATIRFHSRSQLTSQVRRRAA